MKNAIAILLAILSYNVSLAQMEFVSNCDLINENDIIFHLDSLDGVTLSMLDTIIGSGPTPLCPEGGAVHNQNWLAFVAKEGEYKIILSASNCVEVGGFIGAQTAIYTNCSFEENVFCQANCNSGDTEIPSDQLVPGETYYLLIDGCAGSTCDITFTIDEYIPLGCVTEWQSSVGGLGGVSFFDYQYGGDTLINGVNYRKINILPTPAFQPTRYIREKDRIVYEYSTFSNSENKIYDFTLEVGDQFEYSSGFVGTVTKVDTVVISSGKYTRWTLDGPGPPYTYIEGIGGDHLFYADQLGISDPVFGTSCVFKYCDKIVGLDECESKMDWNTSSYTETNICEGESIIWNGITINEAGEYSEIISNSVGCDSTITISVSLLPLGISNIQETLCAGENLVINEIIFDEISPTGTIVITDGAANGCDSIINVELQFLDAITENYQATICEGSSEIWAGDTITLAGDYTFNLMSSFGCDSIINLSVDVIPDIITQIILEECEGETIVVDGVTYTESGAFVTEYEAANGCDSVVNLAINFLPAAFATDTIYFCPNDTIEAGIYEEVTSGVNGCDSVTTIYAIELLPSDPECATSVYDLDNLALNVSPNPFDHYINISAQETIHSVKVTNIAGVTVGLIEEVNSQNYSFNGDQLTAGVYILTVRSKDKIAVQKIVKN